MNRRHFLAVIAALIATPQVGLARFIQPVENEAEDFAEVKFIATSDDVIRSLGVRVSQWVDDEAAEEHRQFALANAGSNLPEGEFYQTEPVELNLPLDLVLYPVTAMGWHTTVGVAAYRTEWVLLAVRRDTLVWEVRVSGAEVEPVLELAGSVVAPLTWREIELDLFSLLPSEDDVPENLALEYRMSPEGTFDPQGTPVPEPTPE